MSSAKTSGFSHVATADCKYRMEIMKRRLGNLAHDGYIMLVAMALNFWKLLTRNEWIQTETGSI